LTCKDKPRTQKVLNLYIFNARWIKTVYSFRKTYFPTGIYFFIFSYGNTVDPDTFNNPVHHPKDNYKSIMPLKPISFHHFELIRKDCEIAFLHVKKRNYQKCFQAFNHSKAQKTRYLFNILLILCYRLDVIHTLQYQVKQQPWKQNDSWREHYTRANHQGRIVTLKCGLQPRRSCWSSYEIPLSLFHSKKSIRWSGQLFFKETIKKKRIGFIMIIRVYTRKFCDNWGKLFLARRKH